MFQYKPVPSSWDLSYVDGDGEHGLYYGCRSCGKKPTEVISPKADQSKTIPSCGNPVCRDQIERRLEAAQPVTVPA